MMIEMLMMIDRFHSFLYVLLSISCVCMLYKLDFGFQTKDNYST